MLGAIIGDIVGSPYEFDDYNIKTTDFPLFSDESEITDDTIMTLAVAQGLMNGVKDPQKTYNEITKQMSVMVRGKEYELKWLQDNQVVALVDFTNAALGADNYSVIFQINGEFKTLGVMSDDYTVAAKLSATAD